MCRAQKSDLERFLPLQEVHRNVSDGGQVVRRMFLEYLTGILLVRNLQRPGQFILYAAMLAC